LAKREEKVDKLKGKVALVTGASRSIGKAIALALAHEGVDLMLAGRSTDSLKQVASSAAGAGVRAEFNTTDVTSEKQIDALFDKLMECYGKLDILVNNAGVFDNAPIDQLAAETWDRVIATNLRAPFLCSRAALRIMKKQGGGRIINIGSISAQRPRMNNAAYTSAKFGLVGLTHSTALEGREFGINCGVLHPGMVRRDLGLGIDEPMMEPEEIAAAVVYMANQPLNVNVLELIQLPTQQLYLGRG
jgi:NAD(P)-dependent dehydrogenase (short-subunit alcohol dehydrogenase family)